MFQKIRSNRDPEKTIWSEVHPIVSPYFSKANAGFSSILKKEGKVIYAGMIVLIIVSTVLSFFVLDTPDNPLDKPLPSATGVQNPHQREENRFIEKLIVPAYPDTKLVQVPYSGHLVLQVMSEHGILRRFINGIINDGVVTPVEYDVEKCYVYYYEKGRVAFRDGDKSAAKGFLEKSLKIKETSYTRDLLKKC